MEGNISSVDLRRATRSTSMEVPDTLELGNLKLYGRTRRVPPVPHALSSMARSLRVHISIPVISSESTLRAGTSSITINN